MAYFSKPMEVHMNFRKMIALFLSLLFVVVCFATSAYAVEYRTAGTSGKTGISDAYAASVYYDRFQNIPLTGDGRIDTVAIALSQIGYSEGDDEAGFSGTTEGSNNFTEFNYNFGNYGSGYGGSYAWCASFVSFALYQAETHDYNKLSDWCRDHEGDSNYIWREISCIKWLNQLNTYGYFQKSAYYGGSYTPQTGDLIFFGSSSTASNHVGLVVYCDGTNVYTVEGNTSQASGLNANGGGVYFKSYPLSTTTIRGYGVLPYETNANAVKPDYSCSTLTTGIYINTNYANTGISKQVYRDAACTTNYATMATNEQFEITEFVSENIAKCKFYRYNSTTFKEYEGYIKLDDGAKLVQAVSYGVKYGDPVEPDLNNTFVSISSGNGYIAHLVENYSVNGTGTSDKTLTVDYADSIGISGWAGFSQRIINSGYYFDSDTDNVYWNSNFLSAGDATATAAGGSKAMAYDITADVDEVSVGTHTVSFMLKLADGTFVIIDTLTFTSTEKQVDNTTETPTEPPSEETTEDVTEPIEDGSTEESTEDVTDPVEENSTAAPEENSTSETNEPAADEETTADESNSGVDDTSSVSRCGSTIGGVSAIVVAIATTVTIYTKKKRR